MLNQVYPVCLVFSAAVCIESPPPTSCLFSVFFFSFLFTYFSVLFLAIILRIWLKAPLLLTLTSLLNVDYDCFIYSQALHHGSREHKRNPFECKKNFRLSDRALLDVSTFTIQIVYLSCFLG